MGALLNIHLIFCVIHVKTGLSHGIHDIQLFKSKYETILKMVLMYQEE